jgi:hypothetical protein
MDTQTILKLFKQEALFKYGWELVFSEPTMQILCIILSTVHVLSSFQPHNNSVRLQTYYILQKKTPSKKNKRPDSLPAPTQLLSDRPRI